MKPYAYVEVIDGRIEVTLFEDADASIIEEHSFPSWELFLSSFNVPESFAIHISIDVMSQARQDLDDCAFMLGYVTRGSF